MQTYQIHLDNGSVIVTDAENRGAAIAFVEAMEDEIMIPNSSFNPNDPASPRRVSKTVKRHRGRSVVGVAPYGGGDPVPVWGHCVVCKGKGGGYEQTEVEMWDSLTQTPFWCCSDGCHQKWLRMNGRG